MENVSDLQQAGYKGSVHEVILERQIGDRQVRYWWKYDRQGRLTSSGSRSPEGSEWSSEYIYDNQGELIEPRGPERVKNPDGTSTETCEVRTARDVAWSAVPGLHGVGFPMRGASKVVTQFDDRDVAVKVLFLNDSDEVLSRVELGADENGNIVEARQYSGDKPSIEAPDEAFGELTQEQRETFAAFFTAGGLESRVVFRYDEQGRLFERKQFVGDVEVARMVRAYNAHGDVSTEHYTGLEEEGDHRVNFDYEYDSAGNWTLQTASDEYGSSVSRRIFHYYEEASAIG